MNLYHGSPRLLDQLEARPARGVGLGKHKLTGIYATTSRTFAMAFALPIQPDAQGKLAWRLQFEGEDPHILIEAGRLDEMGIGYVYRLPAESFVQLDAQQWISYEAVTPLDYEIVQARSFLHWIEYISTIE